MALFYKKDFAAKAGITTSRLSSWWKAGKVIYEKNGMINDENPINQKFLVDEKTRQAKKDGPKELKLTRPPRPEEMEPGYIERSRKEAIDQDEDEKETFVELQRKKLVEQVEKLQNENRKLKLGNEKVVGNFVPIDQVKSIIIQLSEAIHLAWENEMEERDNRLASKYKLERTEITELRTDRNNTINITKERAIRNAKTMLRRLQNETSDKREVGEHD